VNPNLLPVGRCGMRSCDAATLPGLAMCRYHAGTRLVRAALEVVDDIEVFLVTIPGVEVLEVGEDWATSTGTFTFEADDLVSAIESQDDPAVRTPIIKLGHVDPRFDGQPSFGRLEGLTLSANAQTLLTDLTAVPAWLAKVSSSAYPRRSIEGWFDYTTRTGNQWAFVLTALALLGDAYPAIETLEDLQALWGSTVPTLVPTDDLPEVLASETAGPTRMVRVAAATTEGDTVNPTRKGVKAATSVEDIRRAYYESLDGPGEWWWWIREVRVSPAELIVDDDEGHLFRVGYTIGGADEITFADPVEVVIEYVDVAASAPTIPVAAAGQWVAARYKGAAEAGREPDHIRAAGTTAAPPEAPADGGPSTTASGSATIPGDGDREEPQVNLSEKALKALRLEPGATEAQINAALEAQGETEAGGGDAGGGGDGGGDGTTTAPGTTTETTTTTTTPGTTEAPAPGTTTTPEDGTTAPAGVTVPEGMVLVDAATAQAATQAMADLAAERVAREEQSRIDLVDGAIRAGKFGRSRRDHYLAQAKIDPEGTRDAISKMAEVIPVHERGVAASGAVEGSEGVDAYPDSWKPKGVAAAGRSRVKVVGD
jgi:hypothetical protein